jgi:hypothetical protein
MAMCETPVILGRVFLEAFLCMQSGAAEQRKSQQGNGTPGWLHMFEPALGADSGSDSGRQAIIAQNR